MNFVEGGRCSVNGSHCLLGSDGISARNEDGRCGLHGRFDVWLTQDNNLLISDLGFPSDEPKRCLALGINRNLAEKIAEKKASELGTKILSTRHECLQCSKPFWTSDHNQTSRFAKTGQSYLCPECINKMNDKSIVKKLGVLQYWCG